MTKDDLKDQFKNISEDEFIKLKKHPEFEYNLKGQFRSTVTGEIVEKFYYREPKHNIDNRSLDIILTYRGKKTNIFRDILYTLYKENKIYRYIMRVKERNEKLVPWSNISILKSNSTIYTEEEVRNFIKENNVLSKSDLRRKNATMHSSANNLGLLKDEKLFPRLPLPIDPDATINVVYGYFSKKRKSSLYWKNI